MSRKERKAAQHQALIDALDAEAAKIRHNAEVQFPYEKIPKGLEDYAWGVFQDYASDVIRDIDESRYDSGYIEGYIAKRYGKVYTWGRNGATCAPLSWIREGGGLSYSAKRGEDLMDGRSRAYGWRLLADMRAWNEYVAGFCSKENILEVVMPQIEEKLEEKLEEQKEEARALARLLTA